MITISKGKKKRKLQKQEEHRQKKKRPASYFKGPKIKKYDEFPSQNQKSVDTSQDPLTSWAYHRLESKKDNKPKIIRSWKPSEKYSLGFPNDVVLNILVTDIRINRDYDDIRFKGVMPVGYDVLVTCPTRQRYDGTGPIVITNFERADDTHIPSNYEDVYWHLRYHAKTVTLDEIRNSKEYQEATLLFLEEAISSIKSSLRGIRRTIKYHKGVPKNPNLHDYMMFLRKASFYYKSIKGVEDFKSTLSISPETDNILDILLREYEYMSRAIEPSLKV